MAWLILVMAILFSLIVGIAINLEDRPENAAGHAIICFAGGAGIAAALFAFANL